MTSEKITAYAKQQGYAGADFLGRWKGYEVFDPYFSLADRNGTAELDVGYPLRILVRGSTIRMTTEEEAFAVLDALPQEDEDDIDTIEEK